ncbi:MAG: hypothetical protein U0931_14435 [Vulcanimicrobiota bacterium]
MKISFRFQGTPGYKDFKLESSTKEATPQQLEDVATFLGGACRLKDSLAFAEGTILSGSARPGEVSLDDNLQARLVLADEMSPFPHLTHQVGEARYRNYPLGGLCPPREQDALVYYKGSTAAGETWYRKYTAHNMSCWPSTSGLVYSLDRKQGTISVQNFPARFTFPRSLS